MQEYKNRIWFDVNLSAICRNYEKIQSNIKPCQLMPVIKANAYGLGVIEIAKSLKKAGVKLIGVATLNEALELKNLNLKSQILGAVILEEIPIAIENNIILPITDLRIAQNINKLAEEQNKIAECNLLIDTGMGRLGILEEGAYDEVQEIVKLKNLNCNGIYSHFPSADNMKNKKTFNQIESFKKLLNKLKTIGIEFENVHIANSDALNNVPECYQAPFNLARTGLDLYGIFDIQRIQDLKLEPTITLKSKIINIRKMKKGMSVGYSETYILEKDQTIATIPAGYADGIPLTPNKNFVIINDTKCPIVGRVSMDYTTINISELIGDINVGDEVILLGCGKKNTITVEDWAKAKGTHCHDILCSFGKRVYRNYIQL